MSNKYTYDQKGKKDISIRKTTGDKQRFTFMLAISSEGIKFPPYVIIKSENKKELFNQYDEVSILRGNTNGNIIHISLKYQIPV